jgi:hypothetical protein
MAETLLAITQESYEAAKTGAPMPGNGWHTFEIHQLPVLQGKSIQFELKVDDGGPDNGKTIRTFPGVAENAAFSIKTIDTACGLVPVFRMGKDKKMHYVFDDVKYLGHRLKAYVRQQPAAPQYKEVVGIRGVDEPEDDFFAGQGATEEAPF